MGRSRLLAALAVCLVAFALLPGGVAAHTDDATFTHHHHGPGAAGPMGGWMGDGAGGWGALGWAWALTWLLLPVALVAGAAALFLRSRGDGGGEDALVVLRERYARGDIDEEEFDRRREKLG